MPRTHAANFFFIDIAIALCQDAGIKYQGDDKPYKRGMYKKQSNLNNSRQHRAEDTNLDNKLVLNKRGKIITYYVKWCEYDCDSIYHDDSKGV